VSIEREFEIFKKDVLLRLREELEDIEEFPYDFNSDVLHDVIHEEVDGFVTVFTRNECLAWIDFCNNEEYVDKGVIDYSSIDQQLLTTAFECIRMKLFDDDIFQELQEYEMTEKQRDDFIKKINALADKHKYDIKKPKSYYRKHNETQIWIKTSFEIRPEMFKEPYFVKEQVIDLHNGVKILTSNKSINRNAIVFEKRGDKQYRVYLMEKDKDIDIRDFFKYRSIAEGDFVLHPSFYVKGRNEPIKQGLYPYKTEFKDKKEFIFYVNKMMVELNKR